MTLVSVTSSTQQNTVSEERKRRSTGWREENNMENLKSKNMFAPAFLDC